MKIKITDEKKEELKNLYFYFINKENEKEYCEKDYDENDYDENDYDDDDYYYDYQVNQINENFHLFNLEEKINLQEFFDWDEISLNQKLSNKDMITFSKYLNWRYISEYRKLSKKDMITFSKYLNWDMISKYQKISEKDIIILSKYLNWKCISEYQKLSIEFIEKNKELIDWDSLSYSKYLNINDKMIFKFYDKLNIKNILLERVEMVDQDIYNSKKGIYKKQKNFTFKFIEKLSKSKDWDWYIWESNLKDHMRKSNNIKSLDKFMTKFNKNFKNIKNVGYIDQLISNFLSPLIENNNNNLDEIIVFLRKWKDDISWHGYDLKYQTIINKESFHEFSDQFHWSYLAYNCMLSETFCNKFSDKLDFKKLSGNRDTLDNMSDDFFRKYKDKLDWDQVSKYQIFN